MAMVFSGRAGVHRLCALPLEHFVFGCSVHPSDYKFVPFNCVKHYFIAQDNEINGYAISVDS